MHKRGQFSNAPVVGSFTLGGPQSGRASGGAQTYMECSFLKTVDVKRSSHICVFEQCTFGEEIVNARRQ